MSDTESIQFNEVTDNEEPNVSVGSRTMPQGVDKTGSAQQFNRPPLHGVLSPTARKGQMYSSSASTPKFVVLNDEGVGDSDHTESLQFKELTDVDSPSARGEAKALSRSISNRPVTQESKRPPLHSAVPQASRRSHGQSSEGTSLHFVVHGDAEGDDDFDDSDSIQFHTEGASRNVSFKVQSTTSMAETKRGASAVRGQQLANMETADDSLVFFVEDTQSSIGKKINSQRENSHDDTISFVVEDPVTGGGEGTSSAEKSISFVIASADEASEKSPPVPLAAGGKRISTSPSPKSPSEKVSKRAAGSGNAQRKSKRTSVSKKAQGPKEVGTGSARANSRGSTPQHDPNGGAGEGATFNVYKVDGKHTLNKAGATALRPVAEGGLAPRTTNLAGGRALNERQAADDNETLASLVPNAATLLPLPFPQTPGRKVSLKAPDVEEMVLQAKVHTEYWRMFNDVQREEVAQLTERIVRTREGGTNVWEGKAEKEKPSQTSRPLCFSDLFKKTRKDSNRSGNRGRTNAGGAHTSPGAMSTGCGRLTDENKPSANHLGGCYDETGIGTLRIPSPNKRRWPLTRKARRPRPPKTEKTGNSRFENISKEVRDDALAKFAELSGVAWPPSSRDELLFLTGVRLTPKQREQFYESMQLYTVASWKVNMNVYAACEQETAPSNAREVKRKVRVTRTTLLRKAFAVMDIEKTGVISVALLPSVRQLLEEERRNLQDALSGRKTQEAFLTRSRNEKAKLSGRVNTTVSQKKTEGDDDVKAVSALRIYRLVLDVLLPLLGASGLLTFDFTTVGLLVFGTLGLSTAGASPSFLKWREATLRCFDSLLKHPV
ncbi:hypothetical protein, conserved [Trypanosoma brucei gambiense DAL972]|uniref:Uncharacterized protein n=1 Tax=Trypanosoma brucei gambiense (strain MHOM/CI/86/DAL972) TaxID=679716 RepID=C9ZN78_TRYB9|nr:hypothetical protein, conserved [Trypanosoma brucei gambiense DAL972]CBH10732.1 hypothetical protein, conserved [Trypanosoma brucei gambiense DAL972]|eukprot:XP_011773020.1 hypothetical protein, conserved [Trypanosoma brucei gambiense DAL972]